MKKTILSAAFAALMLFTSCDEKIDVPSQASAQKVILDVTIVPDGNPTKAIGTVNTGASNNDTEGETKISTLQIFVFAGDVRDGYVSKNVTTSAQVECTAGTRDIYCIVNGPATLNSIVSKTALLATVSTLVNNHDNFEMVGFKTGQTISTNSSVSIPVNRIASKIVVKSIENALRSGGPIAIKKVYITNVAGQFNYGLDTYAAASGTWYNKGGYRANGSIGNFTQDIFTVNVAAGSTYETNHYFYAYPNNYPQADYNATWAPKRTMLVVQIQYNGKLYDYPVDLGVDLESNKMYVINNLKLVNLGNLDDGNEGGADEENPVTGVTAQVTIDIKDWTVVTLGTNGGITI
ncbi:MAG: hypothetical protein IKN88_07280 [Bacteroidales bacterium]|nr:hypothetical protein [Bacteroidales bacterium]